jgi:hypothetical protein
LRSGRRVFTGFESARLESKRSVALDLMNMVYA